jgi:hypothetical protein
LRVANAREEIVEILKHLDNYTICQANFEIYRTLVEQFRRGSLESRIELGFYRYDVRSVEKDSLAFSVPYGNPAPRILSAQWRGC